MFLKLFQDGISIDLADLVKQLVLPVWVGINQSFKCVSSRKAGRRQNLSLPDSLLELKLLFSPKCSCFSVLQTQTEIYISGFPDSWDFGFRLDDITSFSESAACKWQIVSLLSLHSCVSQFLIRNLLNLSYWFCFCEEFGLIQVQIESHTKVLHFISPPRILYILDVTFYILLYCVLINAFLWL